MKSLILTSVAGVALLGAVALPVLHAQQRGGGLSAFKRPFAGMMLRRAAERIHATDGQKSAGLAVLRTHQPAISPLVDRLIQEKFALRKLSQAPSIDETAVRAESAKVAGIEADLAVQKAYLFHDLRAIATPDQLATIDQMQGEAEQRMLKVVDLVGDWIAHS